MKNYIFGTGPFAIEFAKKLEKHNIIVDGFLKIGNKSNIPQKLYKDIPTIFLNEKCLNPKTDNIFITKKPIIMGDTIEYLKNIGFNKINIVDERVLYFDSESYEQLNSYIDSVDLSLPFLNYLETNVVDHCNLNCKGCAHFSNIYDNNYVDLFKYERDIKLISQKFNVYYFRILGGEPLLHPDFSELLNISRRTLPNTKIVVVSNGLLLDKLDEKVIKSFVDNDIIISISLYEPTNKKIDKILNILNANKITYLINDDFFSPIEPIKKFQTRLTLENNNNGDKVSKECIGRFCRFLRDGKIAKCFYPLLIEILNKRYGTNYVVSRDDYIELSAISSGWDAIKKLNNSTPFCNYCGENITEFDWEGFHKNDKEIDGYVLKKKK